MKKEEKIFFIALAVITMLIFFEYLVIPHKGESVEIRVSGKIVGIYPIDVDKTVKVTGKDGGKNTVLIENGKVRVSEMVFQSSKEEME